MSRFDDDWSAMDDAFGSDGDWVVPASDPVSDLIADSATAPAVTSFIDDLRGLGDCEPPEPSPQLAALLVGLTPLPRSAPRRHLGQLRRRRIVGLIAASVLAGGTGAAAAAGRLPQPAQRYVSDVVNQVTPFTIPAEPDTSAPSPTNSPTAPTETPEHRHSVAPVPEPRDDGGNHDGNDRAGHEATGDGAAAESEPSGGSADGSTEEGTGTAAESGDR